MGLLENNENLKELVETLSYKEKVERSMNLIEEAYESVDWRTVFLVAGMLSLGLAMQYTGTAAYLADLMLSIFGPLGPRATWKPPRSLSMLPPPRLPRIRPATTAWP